MADANIVASVPEGGGDPARDLVPTSGNFPTDRVYYQRVTMGAPAADPGDRPGKLEDGPLDPMSGQGNLIYKKPALGTRYTIEQSWYAQGLTLGQLLHSVALAPGESTRIAVVDWARRTSGSQAETTSQMEDLSALGEQARAISEVSHAVAQETQHGESQSKSQSTSGQAGATGSIGSLLGLSGGFGSSGVASSVATTSGTKDVAADVLQHVQQRTQQHATAARGRRAAVVMETSQAETDMASTRVLTNYDHMHALTMQYFEVLQVFRTETRITRAEPLLFVPLKTFNFSNDVVEGNRWALRAAAAAIEGSLPASEKGMADRIAKHRGLVLALLAPVPGEVPLEGYPKHPAGPVESWPVVSTHPEGGAQLPPRPNLTGAHLTRLQFKCEGTGRSTLSSTWPRAKTGETTPRGTVATGRSTLPFLARASPGWS